MANKTVAIIDDGVIKPLASTDTPTKSDGSAVYAAIADLTETTDAPDGANDLLRIYDNSGAAERKIKPDNLAKKTSTIYLPAGSFIASKTNGATWVGDAELTTNKQTFGFFDFDASTDKGVECGLAMPGDWDGSTIKYKVYWTCTGGAANGTVYWSLAAMSYANDEALDQALGSAVAVSDDWIADYDLHITDLSSALTIGGTPAGKKYVHFKLTRDADNGSDDLSVNARLIGVLIEYTVNKWSEA